MATPPSVIQTLYKKDFCLWVETTLKQLHSKQYEVVDWENLLEEIADLSRRKQDKLKSLLTRLFEHLLKLGYWESEREYNEAKWRAEILNFRIQIKDLLEDSPSLKLCLAEIREKCENNARKIWMARTQLPPETLPPVPMATLEQVLDENWFP